MAVVNAYMFRSTPIVSFLRVDGLFSTDERLIHPRFSHRSLQLRMQGRIPGETLRRKTISDAAAVEPQAKAKAHGGKAA